MCGIVGFVSRISEAPPLDNRRTQRVIDAIRHRGPDAQGEYFDSNLWMAHVRLSILDLSSAGNQPMASADGRYVISYNGEVYNFRELAGELSLSDLRSHSDTEIVLRAFEKLGVNSLCKLNGMFAFAVYDKRSQKLWLVRDRLGIKPLYYRIDDRCLIFGSEIKAILALMDEAPVCNLSSLHEWLYYGNTHGGRTLYQGIKQLQPGHCVEIDLKSFKLIDHEYWSLKNQASCLNMLKSSTGEMIAETKRLLEAAVHRQLVSDVPVGVFLSGGVDSSAITAFASKHYAGRLATYSAGFDDLAGVDERPKARRVSEHFGTEHHELYIHGESVADLVEKMVHHHDMPFSDAANIPLYLMASQISKVTKVVLQGDGGDEVFGGYRRYVTLRHRPWFHPIARWLQRLHGILPKSSFHYRVQRYLHAFAAEDVASTMALLLTPTDPCLTPTEVFAPHIRKIIEREDPFTYYRECQRLFADHDIGNQMSLVDLMIELPDIFLEKVDRSTMAASLEVRVPFLDHDLVDYVVRIPGKRKMPWGKKKWLLKQALKGIIPQDVLSGPKTGFNVPFGYWLRTSLKPLFFDHLTRFTRERPDVLDTAKVHEMYATIRGREDCRSPMIWNLLNLMIWCNNSKVCINI